MLRKGTRSRYCWNQSIYYTIYIHTLCRAANTTKKDTCYINVIPGQQKNKNLHQQFLSLGQYLYIHIYMKMRCTCTQLFINLCIPRIWLWFMLRIFLLYWFTHNTASLGVLLSSCCCDTPTNITKNQRTQNKTLALENTHIQNAMDVSFSLKFYVYLWNGITCERGDILN